MESVFCRFDSYDFAADQRFQDGRKTLQDTGTGNELLDMKLFFYNRYELLLCMICLFTVSSCEWTKVVMLEI